MAESPFSAAATWRPADVLEYRGVTLPQRFGPQPAEYAAVRESAGLLDRSDRGLIVVRGRERKSWLHNLVTNAVKDLPDGAGVYAFAIDVRGRTQFDLNILAVGDELWLDIDHATVPAAIAHLDRYLLSEDAKLEAASERFARLGVCGARSAHAAAALGIDSFEKLAPLASLSLDSAAARLVRHDFAGLPGFELIVPRADAAAWWDRLAALDGITPAGFETLDVLRIEAGIPWLGRDIDDKVIPPETGQVERGINYHKGCYLGQEVIERMRSHGSLARRLVRIRLADGGGIELPAALMKEGKDAGRLTSLVRHPQHGDWIGLAYLRTSIKDPAGVSVADPPREIEVLSA